MATPYVKQAWIDGDATKPTSAARMGVIEQGVFDAHYRPSVAVYRSTAQAILNTTVTIVTFDTELYDDPTSPMHSTSSNTGRLIAPVAGKYLITGTVNFAANATGTRTLQARLNGTTVIDEHDDDGTATSSRALRIARPYVFAASDYVELLATQSSGGTLNTGSGVAAVHFELSHLSY